MADANGTTRALPGEGFELREEPSFETGHNILHQAKAVMDFVIIYGAEGGSNSLGDLLPTKGVTLGALDAVTTLIELAGREFRRAEALPRRPCHFSPA